MKQVFEKVGIFSAAAVAILSGPALAIHTVFQQASIGCGFEDKPLVPVSVSEIISNAISPAGSCLLGFEKK